MEGSREWSLEVWVLEHTLSLITWATCIEDNPSCTSSVHKLILKDWTRWFYVIFGYTVLQPNRHTLFHLDSGPLGDLGFRLSHNKRKVMKSSSGKSCPYCTYIKRYNDFFFFYKKKPNGEIVEIRKHSLACSLGKWAKNKLSNSTT